MTNKTLAEAARVSLEYGDHGASCISNHTGGCDCWKADLRAALARDEAQVCSYDGTLAAIYKALNHVYELCKHPERWRMSIPVDKERDSDVIICDALQSALSALATAHSTGIARGRLLTDVIVLEKQMQKSNAAKSMARDNPELAAMNSYAALILAEVHEEITRGDA